MTFGRVAIESAVGGVLAHTLRAGGRVLKKGRVLDAADVDDLRAAGHAGVICALLDETDVGEDAAAQAVARAIAGAHVRVAEPATGRCNLFAAAAGLLQIDRAAVDRLNSVDEAITIATLPPSSPVIPDEMVGTVKIIPFAVARGTLDRLVAGASALLGVIPWRAHRAGLISTRFPSTPETLLDRAAGSQRERMRRLGGELAAEARVEHDEGAVAGALADMLAAGLSPVLLLGASAIVDRQDVLPAAVERVGGAIDHLGMPVDPGNLLLLAHHGDTPIIGVPGCARSLNRSGFDWVLERICAGVPLGSNDLTSMGVGGLLLEAPTRPHPRLGGTPADED